MSDKLELASLAERCEAATEASRELDCLIWRATAELPEGYRWQEVNGEWCQIGLYGISDLDICEQAFTASLDAAMSLVPSGRQWGVQSFDGAAPAIGWIGKEWVIRNAATPALALCAAALKARALHTKVEDSRG